MLAASPQPGAGRVPDSLSTCTGGQIDGQTPRQTPSQGDVWGQPQRGCASPQQTAGAPRLLDKLPTAPPAGPSCTIFTGGGSPSTAGHLENRLHEKSPSTAVKPERPNTLTVQHTASGGARPGMNLASRLFVSVIY